MTGKQPKATPMKKKSYSKPLTIDTYAAQCDECMKWRVIASEEDYMDIRSKLPEESFVCDAIGASCEDGAELEMEENNDSQMWVLDKPGIPRTPQGFQRILVPRSNKSKIDVYYVTPMQKRVKCLSELTSFVEANPDYKDLALSKFSFKAPKVLNHVRADGNEEET